MGRLFYCSREQEVEYGVGMGEIRTIIILDGVLG